MNEKTEKFVAYLQTALTNAQGRISEFKALLEKDHHGAAQIRHVRAPIADLPANPVAGRKRHENYSDCVGPDDLRRTEVRSEQANSSDLDAQRSGADDEHEKSEWRARSPARFVVHA